MLFRFLTEHCKLQLPTMALYILWYHASVLVCCCCCCCCCCCFIQLRFLQHPPRCAGRSPPSRPPGEVWPGAGGRTTAAAAAAAASFLGHWRRTLFSLFIPLMVNPPFFFLGKATHCSFLFYIPNMRLTKLNAVYIYIYIYTYIYLRENSPTDGEPPFLFFW